MIFAYIKFYKKPTSILDILSPDAKQNSKSYISTVCIIHTDHSENSTAEVHHIVALLIDNYAKTLQIFYWFKIINKIKAQRS